MQRHNPYSLPENYLDNLQHKILSSVKDIPQHEADQSLEFEAEVSWGQAWRRLMGFAAGFALLVSIGWSVLYFSTSDTKTTAEQYDAAIDDTARILWPMSEEDVVEIVEAKQNHHIYMAEQAVEYISFFGEADDINIIYYE